MNIEQIRQLAQICKENDLSAIDVNEDGAHIRLERGACAHPLTQAEIPTPREPQDAQAETGVDFNNVTEIKAPMVGVYYAAPSPEAEPFVRVGDRVKKGDVVCVVEAMKLMNDIKAPADGEIVDICADNGAVVEYGQTLIKLY